MNCVSTRDLWKGQLPAELPWVHFHLLSQGPSRGKHLFWARMDILEYSLEPKNLKWFGSLGS